MRWGVRHGNLTSIEGGRGVLCFQTGKCILWAPWRMGDPPPADVQAFLGVDRGIVNIAVDSDGERHSSSHTNSIRHRHRRLRRKLQKKGTKSARRRLVRLAGQEYRFSNDTNHCISKSIVVKAQGTQRGIALEDLGGIRDRITARKSQRATLHSWAFDDLEQKIRYKPRLYAVNVVSPDPRNTSRTRPECG